MNNVWHPPPEPRATTPEASPWCFLPLSSIPGMEGLALPPPPPPSPFPLLPHPVSLRRGQKARTRKVQTPTCFQGVLQPCLPFAHLDTPEPLAQCTWHGRGGKRGRLPLGRFVVLCGGDSAHMGHASLSLFRTVPDPPHPTPPTGMLPAGAAPDRLRPGNACAKCHQLKVM